MTFRRYCDVESRSIPTARQQTGQRIWPGRRLFVLALAVLFLWPAAAIGFSTLGSNEMSSGDLEQRGKKLRTALEDAYRIMITSHTLRGGIHGNDLTATVMLYIPVGTSFKDAEAILRDAGFSIEPYPNLTQPPNPNRASDWYAVIAKISPLAPGDLSKADLYVSLLPISPGDYSKISRITATLFTSSL
jgi:hypothetical protein